MRSSVTTLIVLNGLQANASFTPPFIAQKELDESAHSKSLSISGSNSRVGSAILSGLARSGILPHEEADFVPPLGFLGITRTYQRNMGAYIPVEIVSEGSTWGTCTKTKSEGRIEVIPTTETMDQLQRQLFTPQVFSLSPSTSTVESIGRLNPREVFNLDHRVEVLETETLIAQGESILRMKLWACQNGFMDNRSDPQASSRDEVCESAPSVKLLDDGLRAERLLRQLFSCLVETASEPRIHLSNADRKLAIDLGQIQKDLHRNGILNGEVVEKIPNESEEDYDSRNSIFVNQVIEDCEKLTVVWLLRIVPWMKFLQAFYDPCFFLMGIKKLNSVQALEGLIIFRDKITRNSRYVDERYFEYNRWLSVYWGNVLLRYFENTFMDLPLSDLDHKLSIFALRPAVDPSNVIEPIHMVPIWDFIYANGRPGFFCCLHRLCDCCKGQSTCPFGCLNSTHG